MSAGPHGVLVVDKPRGPTSHDLVAWTRRALGTRSVGHAGTLDPLASGVLVLLVGEATKLSPFLSADDKRYDAVIALGRETDTLDAAGVTVAEAPVPPLTFPLVHAALAAFMGETLQLAPVVSALKKEGVTLHARARRGESVSPPTRPVILHSFTLTTLAPENSVASSRSVSSPSSVASPTSVVSPIHGPPQISVSLHVGKGFYVRSLARDLAVALGTRGHLASLRRTSSGPFLVEEGLDAETLRDETKRDRVRAALIPLAAACARAMPTVTVDDACVADARAGRAISLPSLSSFPPASRIAVLDSVGALVCIAEPRESEWRVVRGFAATLPT